MSESHLLSMRLGSELWTFGVSVAKGQVNVWAHQRFPAQVKGCANGLLEMYLLVQPEYDFFCPFI